MWIVYRRDCSAPDIQSVIPSNSQPCAGEDVTVTAHILDDHGVASAILNFDSPHLQAVNMLLLPGTRDLSREWAYHSSGPRPVPGPHQPLLAAYALLGRPRVHERPSAGLGRPWPAPGRFSSGSSCARQQRYSAGNLVL